MGGRRAVRASHPHIHTQIKQHHGGSLGQDTLWLMISLGDSASGRLFLEAGPPFQHAMAEPGPEKYTHHSLL